MVDFNKFDIAAALTDSIVDMFDGSFSMELEPLEDDGASDAGGRRLVGSVSLSGLINGSLSIAVGDDFSRIMTASMLGVEVDEIEGTEEITEVLGKAFHNVGENLKLKFTDAGLTCEISPPSFTSVKDSNLESKNFVRYERCAFRCGEEIILAEIGLTVEEEAIPENQTIDADAPETPRYGSANAPPKPDHHSGETGAALDPTRRSDHGDGRKSNFGMILDIPVEITVELGRTSILVDELLKLCNGSVVEFSNLSGEPVDVMINQKRVARGYIVVMDEKYGVRISETMTDLY
jgi:flagellar motor switch protein FliN